LAAPSSPAALPAAPAPEPASPTGSATGPPTAPGPGDRPAPQPGAPTPSRDGAVGLDGGPLRPDAAAQAPLNLQVPRGSATAPAEPGRGLLPILPAVPPKSKLAEGIEKAAKPDCRNAYSGMGLLAVVPLARDAVKDNGCRW
jgi:hypothetical protein